MDDGLWKTCVSEQPEVIVNDMREGACGEQGGALSEPQHRLRAGSTPPMTLSMAKQAQRPCQSERRSSGAARGDHEAFVPSKKVWRLLVAAWKSTSLLPAMSFCLMAAYKSRSL
jgi:hypothetical protein